MHQPASKTTRLSSARGRRSALRLGAAALSTPLLPRFAKAAQFTWRLGHTAPLDFPMHLRLTQAAANIAARSQGKMELQIFGNGELGIPVGLLAQVRRGSLDAAPLSSQALANDLAPAVLPTAGFAFADYPTLWAALDGDMGTLLRQQFQTRLGLIALSRCWDFGFRQVTTRDKDIHAVADMAALRLRSPAEAELISLFRSLKSVPLAIPLGVLTKAIRAGEVDGQEGMLPLVQLTKLYEVQSVCALTNHVWDGQWICISNASWSALPANLQEIVATALNESGMQQRQDVSDNNAKTRKALEATGMRFDTIDPSGFRAMLRDAGYYAAFRARVGAQAWASLEKYTGRLA